MKAYTTKEMVLSSSSSAIVVIGGLGSSTNLKLRGIADNVNNVL